MTGVGWPYCLHEGKNTGRRGAVKTLNTTRSNFRAAGLDEVQRKRRQALCQQTRQQPTMLQTANNGRLNVMDTISRHKSPTIEKPYYQGVVV